MKTILRTFVLLFCVASFAQTTVKGTVNDDGGLPLPGANIIIVGTENAYFSSFGRKEHALLDNTSGVML